MKKITILAVFIFSSLCVFAQNAASRLFEYMPAPGQHINIDKIGTPQAAQTMTENLSSLVSLGSFGGYIVLGFENGCINHPDNPYGIDFTIFGNAFAGSSEPGVVWVMKDENGNGLPDDTWYEIAGSSHFHSRTIKNHAVTYYKTETRDVLWKDNRGVSGWVLANNFNLQEYYPMSYHFPDYPRDSVNFTGTLLNSAIDFSSSQEIKILPPAFGYADCRPRVQGVDLWVPDNPYTKEVEGAGGDPIDISWAIDSLGNYVELDSIHFVKIASASLVNIGWLGEISTDIAWVQAVQPQPGISGKETLLVVYHHQEKIVTGDSLLLEAAYFEKGRKSEKAVTYISQNENIATVNSAGKLIARSVGETQVHISAENEVEVITVKVVEPVSIQLGSGFSSVYPGDTVQLNALVYDNEGAVLNLAVHYFSSNSDAGEIIQADGKYFFHAVQPGETVITVSIEGFSLEMQFDVKILSPGDRIKIYFTLKTEEENLLPLQWIEIGLADLNKNVENRKNDYSEFTRPALVHALVSGLEMAGVSYSFRDDETTGGKLYLYSVEKSGLFTYGWGGKTEPMAFARAWIVRLNNNHVLNDFDKTELADGDTVALYHVSNITGPWDFTRLLSVKTAASLNEEIEVLLEKTSCSINDGEIIESGFEPVPNAEVHIGDSFYTTDSGGKALIYPEQQPPLVVSSGSDAVLILEEIATGLPKKPISAFQVFPNPVETLLTIKGKGMISKKVFNITDLYGRIHFSGALSSEISELDLSALSPGIYHLVIFGKNGMETHKIIKR